MAVERTLVLIKPDAMERALAGEILSRFERRGLGVRAAKLVHVDRPLAERHYAEHSRSCSRARER
jgi:nucleoside-diphosphate kinase